MRQWQRALSAVLASIVLLLAWGCGGGGTTPPPSPGSAPMGLFVRDAGFEKLLAFEIQLTGATLVSGSTQKSLLSAPVELELKNLQLATMPLSLTDVVEGTYTLQLTFANPEATVLTLAGTVVKCETGAGCVPSLAPATNPNLNINVQPNVRSALIIDFDLAASVDVTENPIAVAVHPVVRATQISVQGQQPEAELEDVVGTATAINGTNQSFTFQPLGMTTTFTVVTNTQTQFEDFDDANPPRTNAFASIAPNDILEVEAEQRADGGFVAKKVELVEAQNDARVELEGLITNVDLVAGSINMVIRERRHSTTTQTELGREITLNGLATASFRMDPDGLTIDPTLFNDPTDVIRGQFVEAELSGPTTLRRLTLKKATYQGLVTAAPVGNNFSFDPDLALIPAGTVEVLTFPGTTEFRDGLTSISGVLQGMTAAVRGLLVKQPSGALQIYARRVGRVQ